MSKLRVYACLECEDLRVPLRLRAAHAHIWNSDDVLLLLHVLHCGAGSSGGPAAVHDLAANSVGRRPACVQT